MPRRHRLLPAATALGLAAALAVAPHARAAKVTECAKVGLCYCINDDHKAAIDAKIEKFRQVIAA